jgi:hypothetical protein
MFKAGENIAIVHRNLLTRQAVSLRFLAGCGPSDNPPPSKKVSWGQSRIWQVAFRGIPAGPGGFKANVSSEVPSFRRHEGLPRGLLPD